MNVKKILVRGKTFLIESFKKLNKTYSKRKSHKILNKLNELDKLKILLLNPN